MAVSSSASRQSYKSNLQQAVAQKTEPLLTALARAFAFVCDNDALLSFVLCGKVSVNGAPVKNHTHVVREGDVLTIRASIRYASRGARKLIPVLGAWNVNVRDMVWLDAGASTGGFTDALLRRGAAAVHAVDVGYNLLDYRLRTDARVQVHERTNIMSVQYLEPVPHRAVIDVSFRSLRSAAAHVLSLCKDGYALALCKPQFEHAAARGNGHDEFSRKFDGVITDSEQSMSIARRVAHELESEGVRTSRIHPAGERGTKGNLEFFLEISAG